MAHPYSSPDASLLLCRSAYPPLMDCVGLRLHVYTHVTFHHTWTYITQLGWQCGAGLRIPCPETLGGYEG